MHVDYLHREIFHAKCWEFRPLCDKPSIIACAKAKCVHDLTDLKKRFKAVQNHSTLCTCIETLCTCIETKTIRAKSKFDQFSNFYPVPCQYVSLSVGLPIYLSIFNCGTCICVKDCTCARPRSEHIIS